MKRLFVLAFSFALAAPLLAQTVSWQERDAEVWAQEQVVAGTLEGAGAGVLFHNAAPISFEVTDNTFAVPVQLEEGANTFVACTEDEAVCSDTLRWTLGYRLRPEVFAYAEVSGRTVTLHGDVLENPEGDALSFTWQQDPENPQPVALAGTSALQTSFVLPEEAPSGEYYFDLFVATADGDTVRARTFVTAGPDGIQPFDIETDHAAWVDRAIIYEIFPYFMGGYSPNKLQVVTARLPEIAELGVNTIWLQPITQSPEPQGYQGYGVSGYFDVWDALGTKADLRELVETAHDLGLKVMLDFVSNHASIQHPYALDAADHGAASHYYDFFQREEDDAPYSQHYTVLDANEIKRETSIEDSEMQFISYFWGDLVIFNYDDPEAQRFIIEASQYWIEEFDVDGYRFDAVWGTHARNPEFVERWRRELKRVKPEILMLAESKAAENEVLPADFPSIYEAFDVAYDWKSTDWCISQWSWATNCEYYPEEYGYFGPKTSIFKAGLEQHRARNLRNALSNREAGYPEDAVILRYMENNDVPRFRAHHTLEQTQMVAELMFSLPGIPMLYYGQESGVTRQYPTITKEIRAYDDEGLWPYYQYLIRLRATYPSLYSDNFEEVPVTPEAVAGPTFAYRRWAGDEHLVGMVNMGAEEVTAELTLPVEALPVVAEETYYLTDLLTGDYVETTGEGLASVAVTVPGYTTALYVLADSILKVSVPTPIERSAEVPAHVALEQNYPNPFNPATTVPFVLPEAGHVRVQVFDVLGRRVATLVDEERLPGRHEVVFDGQGLPSGVYLLRLDAAGRMATRRMLMVK